MVPVQAPNGARLLKVHRVCQAYTLPFKCLGSLKLHHCPVPDAKTAFQAVIPDQDCAAGRTQRPGWHSEPAAGL